MKKIFKPKTYRICITLVLGITVALMLAFLTSIWINAVYFVPVALLVFFIYFYFLVFDSLFVISISETEIIIKKRGKAVHSFNLGECDLRYQTKSYLGDAERRLFITGKDTKKITIDCSLMGKKDFYDLIDTFAFYKQENLRTTN